MARARRHQRLLSVLAFGLIALAAELLGRSMTHRLDFGRHVRTPSYAGTNVTRPGFVPAPGTLYA